MWYVTGTARIVGLNGLTPGQRRPATSGEVMTSERTPEQIDGDLGAEYLELCLARRSGGAPLVAAWARIDTLLDERLLRMVPGLPHQPPRADDGRVVPA